MAVRVTPVGEAIRALWLELPYHGYGPCANPGCNAIEHCCGVNSRSRICLGCFEWAYGFKAPNMRRRRAA